MNEFKEMLLANESVLNNFSSLRMDQDVKSRLKYMDVVTEATLSSGGKSKIIQQLYLDIISKANIDFGKIPASKGNILDYSGYEVMMKSIDHLNLLFEGKNIDELTLVNKIHGLILSLRNDFEFGFKFDITIIKLTYNLLVMGLYDLINMTIVAYVDYLKNVQNIEIKFRNTAKKDIMIIGYMKDFIKTVEKGEWAKLVNSFKKDQNNLLGFVTGGAIAISGAPLVVVSLIAFLFAVRGLIYVYYASSMKINEHIKISSEFLKSAIEYQTDTSDDVVSKQKNLLAKMESLSNFIEAKILKTNKDASVKIKKSNKDNFNTEKLSSVDLGGIEIL